MYSGARGSGPTGKAANKCTDTGTSTEYQRHWLQWTRKKLLPKPSPDGEGLMQNARPPDDVPMEVLVISMTGQPKPQERRQRGKGGGGAIAYIACPTPPGKSISGGSECGRRPSQKKKRCFCPLASQSVSPM